MAKFEIDKAVNGQYYFRLRASVDDKIILRSEMYQAKSGCERGIASVKANAPLDERYERLYSSNGKYYFNLKAANGEVIGTSDMYATSEERATVIELVKKQAPDAPVVDLT